MLRAIGILAFALTSALAWADGGGHGEAGTSNANTGTLARARRENAGKDICNLIQTVAKDTQKPYIDRKSEKLEDKLSLTRPIFTALEANPTGALLAMDPFENETKVSEKIQECLGLRGTHQLKHRTEPGNPNTEFDLGAQVVREQRLRSFLKLTKNAKETSAADNIVHWAFIARVPKIEDILHDEEKLKKAFQDQYKKDLEALKDMTKAPTTFLKKPNGPFEPGEIEELKKFASEPFKKEQMDAVLAAVKRFNGAKDKDKENPIGGPKPVVGGPTSPFSSPFDPYSGMGNGGTDPMDNGGGSSKGTPPQPVSLTRPQLPKAEAATMPGVTTAPTLQLPGAPPEAQVPLQNAGAPPPSQNPTLGDLPTTNFRAGQLFPVGGSPTTKAAPTRSTFSSIGSRLPGARSGGIPTSGFGLRAIRHSTAGR